MPKKRTKEENTGAAAETGRGTLHWWWGTDRTISVAAAEASASAAEAAPEAASAAWAEAASASADVVADAPDGSHTDANNNTGERSDDKRTRGGARQVSG